MPYHSGDEVPPDPHKWETELGQLRAATQAKDERIAELEAQNATLRDAQKICESCDAPTLAEFKAAQARVQELESLRETQDVLLSKYRKTVTACCDPQGGPLAVAPEMVVKYVQSLRDRVQELEAKLTVVGEMAVADWDDKAVGAVDSAVPHENQVKYKDVLRRMFVEQPKELEELRAKLAAHPDTVRLNWLEIKHHGMKWNDANAVISQLKPEDEKYIGQSTTLRAAIDAAINATPKGLSHA
jgi:hypothetical protein